MALGRLSGVWVSARLLWVGVGVCVRVRSNLGRANGCMGGADEFCLAFECLGVWVSDCVFVWMNECLRDCLGVGVGASCGVCVVQSS